MGLLNSVLKIFVGNKAERDFKSMQDILKSIQNFEKEFVTLSHDELRGKTAYFRSVIKENCAQIQTKIKALDQTALKTNDISKREAIYSEIDELQERLYQKTEDSLNQILPEAFAIVKETAKRFRENKEISVTATASDREVSATKDYVSLNGEQAIWKNSWNASGKEVVWDMVHYDVQLVGGIALHKGKIAEMQTGEGKTLVATLPLYLNALSGNGVHLVTVNDYLAKRDSAWMAPLFEFHGLRVDCIDKYQPSSEGRKNAYKADIIYGTNNEFGFDYLRDNMAVSPDDLVQRQHNYAIVDEVDSVLIDDARTPLIISGPVPEGDRHEFYSLNPKVSELVNMQRTYLTGILSEAKKLIREGDRKKGGFLLYQVFRGLPRNKALIKFLSEDGIKQLLQKTENYHMQDNNREMPKIDEELFFVIDEKNNQIELTEKGVNHLSETQDANFFVLPDIGVEIAKIENQGLSLEEESNLKEELFKDFSIKSERIHTLNQLLKAYTLFEKDMEYVVMSNKVMIVDEQTGRIMEGRRYSDGLHQAIEAKENVKIEAATQTFATITLQNYFRMYKKLSGMTGTAVTEAGEFWEIYSLDVMEIPTNKPIARIDENDLIYKTKREKYNAIITETVKLSKKGRPTLIGTTSVEVSELLGKMLALRKIKHNILNAKLHKKEAEIVAEAGETGVVTIATNMAGRGTDIKISDEVKEKGGLAIIGTERHDSRRVDRQLRGRSGRQGDPGSSQFYVSLEDNLMRLFGSERIAKIMDRMGLKEGEVIQHSMMTKSIERAQKKVEENNFGIRKRLLEYDNVMNSQREVIYKRRQHALEGKRLRTDISNMIFDTCELITQNNKATNDFKNFQFEILKFFAMASNLKKDDLTNLSFEQLTSKLYQEIYIYYTQRIETNTKNIFPIIKQVYESKENNYERMVLPFSDGVKTINVVANLEESYQSDGKKLLEEFEKNVCLAIVDEAWKTHLRKMDELKQSVQLSVHEQKDPLLIYKFEAFELFKVMLENINKDVVSFLFKSKLPSQNPGLIREAKNISNRKQKLDLSKEELPNMEEISARNRGPRQNRRMPEVETVVREKPKIGRNERVSIKNIQNGEVKSLKFKQAETLIDSGEWVVVS
ncbi:protein translocase subunit SecA [Elysia marginata]|uniref:Protein translocase subunit SecA n=1 Tax=Elysia marginata TaxID=1093978 RepID=A0AAV4GMB6_9GAST|nr:protein translocase subunit SecA [Elysia marginata]